MKSEQDSIALVVAGKWNVYILSPEWIAYNLFEQKEIKVEFSLSLELPPRYTYDDIRIIPSGDRVTFHALKYSKETFIKIEKMAQKLVTLLAHTPITGLGFNFSFSENGKENTDLLKIFSISDNTCISGLGHTIKQNSILRQIDITQGILNFTISNVDSTILFDFNFHYEVINNEDLQKKIQSKFISNMEIAENVLIHGYDLAFDE